MHEAGIARNILDKIIEEADKHGGGRVKSVSLSIGTLTHIMDDALRFAFQALAEGTCAEASALEIEHQPADLTCRDCRWSGKSDGNKLRCGACGGTNVDTSGGDEICLVSFKMETND